MYVRVRLPSYRITWGNHTLPYHAMHIHCIFRVFPEMKNDKRCLAKVLDA